MHILHNKLSPFFEKFLKEGKVKFPRKGVIIIEDKLENLLLFIEVLQEEGITVEDNLDKEYLKPGCILGKIVELQLFEKKVQIFPRRRRKG